MTAGGVSAAGPGSDLPIELQGRLRRAATEFQSVFLSRMFQAMHESAVHSSLTEPSAGEQTFRFMLDDQLAKEASARMGRGLGDDLYRALCRRTTEAAQAVEGKE